MKINLQKPVEQYVLVDEITGEFYCGGGYTDSSILNASHWDSISVAKGVRTQYENDHIRGYYLWRGSSSKKLKIMKVIISNYYLEELC